MAKKKKTPRATTIPDDMSTWTHEQFVADARAMQEEDAKYVPTAEERAMGEHFMRKQESASGWYQRDPNAD